MMRPRGHPGGLTQEHSKDASETTLWSDLKTLRPHLNLQAAVTVHPTPDSFFLKLLLLLVGKYRYTPQRSGWGWGVCY